MLHKFSTIPLDDNCIHEKVLIDGQPVRCSGYTLTHNIDEVPCVELTIPVNAEIKDESVAIKIANKEEIARVMDDKEFVDFCVIWNEVHKCE